MHQGAESSAVDVLLTKAGQHHLTRVCCKRNKGFMGDRPTLNMGNQSGLTELPVPEQAGHTGVRFFSCLLLGIRPRECVIARMQCIFMHRRGKFGKYREKMV